MKDFLTIEDIPTKKIFELLTLATKLKKEFIAGKKADILNNKILAMVFDKPSTRTRVSFEAAMVHVGGAAMLLESGSIGKGQRESIADVARTLSRMVDAIMIRTFSHEVIEELAKHATIPIINGLTDYSHPCQALADILTIQEHAGKLEGLNLTYVGDGNNVARSLAFISQKVGINFTISTPKEYALADSFVKRSKLIQTTNPHQAVAKADFIYTDVWTSMGQEAESEKRKAIFKPYQLNKELLDSAPANVKILHCLPAHRGEEITNEVIEADNSIVFDQAENRLHAQKAVLVDLLS